MKKSTLIKAFCLPTGIAIAAIPTVMMTTSCSNNAVPTAPNDFYCNSWDGANPFMKGYDNSVVKAFNGNSPEQIEVHSNSEFISSLASAYTLNMCKWDVICGVMQAFKGYTFTAKFKSFEKNGAKVKYDVEVTKTHANATTWHTTKDETTPGDPFDWTDLRFTGKISEGNIPSVEVYTSWIGPHISGIDAFSTYFFVGRN